MHATTIIEENKQQKKTANLKSEQIISRRLLSLNEEETKVDGYVAFTADYKLPRHHPPKNN